MEVMKFGDAEYEIVDTLYRSRGSQNQQLGPIGEAIPPSGVAFPNLEERRTFYLVRETADSIYKHPVNPDAFRHTPFYFVKEYTDPEYGGTLGFPANIEYEFNETRRMKEQGRNEHGMHDIGVVDMIALEGNRLLMEYLEGYRKFTLIPTGEVAGIVNSLIYEWIMRHDVHDYDLVGNNIMVKSAGNQKISVRLIDFEYSADRDPKKEWGFKE